MRKNLLIYILLTVLFVWVGTLSLKETPVSSNKVIEEVIHRNKENVSVEFKHITTEKIVKTKENKNALWKKNKI